MRISYRDEDINNSDEENKLELYNAEKYLNNYLRIKRFSIRQKRIEISTENGTKVLRKITWEYNCNRTRLVATAFLEDETEEIVFTDSDPAMSNKNLREKYSSISDYINRQLDPLKTKWAICYTHSQFTAEIQQLLDNEAKYIRTIHVPKIDFRFLRQMQKCFYYDTFILDIMQWETNIKAYNEDNYNKGTREDNYKVAKYVILISDRFHRCTCNLLITHGYPCRHFYKILRLSPNVKWHIRLISSRWYKDEKIIFDTNDINIINQHSPISLCNIRDSEIINHENNFSLEYIKKVRGSEVFTPKLQKLNNNRVKYKHAYGMMRKVIDLALATNSYEELIGMCQDFLNNKQEILASQNLVKESISNKELNITGIANPIITVRKKRPIGRAKNARGLASNFIN
ncbi:hypothetical protein Glove_242g174 [Diversispora epigaea]|uniref:SWIM-type domain-containing protein n=1 Tax=Diversispora epigaea TaxID=1348612 RepID=A0A397IC51_9GLOM|nr:hypothetical protein Glove_242g174 [Diversispora epigaea]